LSDDEIERRMQSFSGPHGNDPQPVLRVLGVPSLWILGEHDRSIPLRKTVATLEALAADGKPITTRVYPGANHGLRRTATGEQPDFWRAIEDWLRTRGVLHSP
jgi:acetyl esterase/lipase